MKIRTVEIIIIMLLVLVITLLFIDIYRLRQEGAKCLANPVTFGLQKISTMLKNNIYCMCNEGLQINSTGMFRKLDYLPGLG